MLRSVMTEIISPNDKWKSNFSVAITPRRGCDANPSVNSRGHLDCTDRYHHPPISINRLLMPFLDYCLLSKNIYDYRIVSQGKTTIPGVNDAEGWEETDVRIGPLFVWNVFIVIKLLLSVSSFVESLGIRFLILQNNIIIFWIRMC